MALGRGMESLDPEDYVRQQDRVVDEQPGEAEEDVAF
jgi:hypothetical protein